MFEHQRISFSLGKSEARRNNGVHKRDGPGSAYTFNTFRLVHANDYRSLVIWSIVMILLIEVHQSR